MISFLRARLKSFGHALRPLPWFFGHEVHARIHLCAGIAVFGLALFLGCTALEWALLILTVALVLCAELFNTALEQALNRLHPEQHAQIGLAKDLAAAAVLVLSFGAAALGLCLFGPKLWALCCSVL